jgi:hypothetical protein
MSPSIWPKDWPTSRSIVFGLREKHRKAGSRFAKTGVRPLVISIGLAQAT